MSSLTDHAQALLEEAQKERARLLRNKDNLVNQREHDITQVREQYRERLDAIDGELELSDRLWKALDPPGFKEETARRTAERKAKTFAVRKPAKQGLQFKPSDEAVAQVLQAMADGAEMIYAIAAVESVGYSRATVDNVIKHGREQGWVRLAGTAPGSNGRQSANRWKLTPEGQEWLASRAGVTNGADA